MSDLLTTNIRDLLRLQSKTELLYFETRRSSEGFWVYMAVWNGVALSQTDFLPVLFLLLLVDRQSLVNIQWLANLGMTISIY